MRTYFGVILCLVIVQYRIDRSCCDNQTNDGTVPENYTEAPISAQCTEVSYQCNDGTCIDLSSACDGVVNCIHGDDEDNCIFQDNHSSFFCAKTEGACSCYHDTTDDNMLNYLNCSEAGLVSVPKVINRGVEVIDLSGNNITKLTSNMLEFSQSIAVLLMGRNRISTIEINTFNTERASWTHIDLSANELTKLTPGMFNGLEKSESLKINLQDNEISVIENHSFRGLERLYHLNLNGNRITKLTSGMFEGIPWLVTLSLRNNKIYSIESNIFNSLTSLSTLDLSGNKLSTLTSGMFNSSWSDLYSLLNLSNNEISVIEPYAFQSPVPLKVLDLSGNRLQKLPSYTFEHIAGVYSLSLERNEISQIEPSTFNKLNPTVLQNLNLLDNPLHDVDENLFEMNNEMMLLLVDDIRICCITRKRICNNRRSATFFCDELSENTLWYCYFGAGILLTVVVVVMAVFIFKRNIIQHKRRYDISPTNTL